MANANSFGLHFQLESVMKILKTLDMNFLLSHDVEVSGNRRKSWEFEKIEAAINLKSAERDKTG
jgi:hypothetical protein